MVTHDDITVSWVFTCTVAPACKVSVLSNENWPYKRADLTSRHTFYNERGMQWSNSLLQKDREIGQQFFWFRNFCQKCSVLSSSGPWRGAEITLPLVRSARLYGQFSLDKTLTLQAGPSGRDWTVPSAITLCSLLIKYLRSAYSFSSKKRESFRSVAGISLNEWLTYFNVKTNQEWYPTHLNFTMTCLIKFNDMISKQVRNWDELHHTYQFRILYICSSTYDHMVALTV